MHDFDDGKAANNQRDEEEEEDEQASLLCSVKGSVCVGVNIYIW